MAPNVLDPGLPAADETIGWEVIEWIETFLVHGPGDVQGEPIVLDDEATAFVLKTYKLRADGARQYRRAVYSRPKGRAKSELAAMLACAEALGPVRFDGYDADGMPVGRPVTRAEIVTVATELGQAGNVYNAITYMLSEGPLADTEGLDPGYTRTNLPEGGQIIPGSGSAGAKDGQRPTFVIADETHLMFSRELRELHSVMRRNLAKRKLADPWMLETTTMYRPGQNSVAEGSHRYANAIIEGRIHDDGFLYDHRQGPLLFDWDDDDQLLAALAESYGDAAKEGWIDLHRLLAEIRDPMTSEHEARRYFLNQPSKGETQWLNTEVWDACAGAELPPPGTTITLGFDGSLFDDATALVACTLSPEEIPVIFIIGLWEAPEDQREWEVDRLAVDEKVHWAFQNFDVVRMYGDPALWQDHLARWSHDYPKRVFEWWTNRNKAMTEATERLETAIKTGEVRHTGDPVLARHVGNAHVRKNRWGHTLVKDRRGSPRKIDAAMAAILAYEARSDVLASGKYRKRGSELVSF